jgi:hypothetical protein
MILSSCTQFRIYLCVSSPVLHEGLVRPCDGLSFQVQYAAICTNKMSITSVSRGHQDLEHPVVPGWTFHTDDSGLLCFVKPGICVQSLKHIFNPFDVIASIFIIKT